MVQLDPGLRRDDRGCRKTGRVCSGNMACIRQSGYFNPAIKETM